MIAVPLICFPHEEFKEQTGSISVRGHCECEVPRGQQHQEAVLTHGLRGRIQHFWGQ